MSHHHKCGWEMNGVGKLWKDLGPKFLAHGKEAPQIGQVFFLVQNNVVVIMRGGLSRQLFQ